MAVKITLEDGREVLVRNGLADVKRAFEAALSAGEPLRIDTPQGTLYINPAQIVSFESLAPALASQAQLTAS